jgi:predicted aspartyl protease/regulator of sirC expression with transglutaminase-like and TPR domain
MTGALLAAAVLLAPEPAVAACKVARMLELPVTVTGRRPMVTAQLGGRDLRFILDSGAFYSTISRANAAEFGLTVSSLPPTFRVSGVGGSSTVGEAIVRDFTLGGVAIQKVSFIVGGSDTGTAGLIGQNILGLADVEYDLPHGVVRLMKTTDCGKRGLAYWAGTKPVTVLPLIEQPQSNFNPHTVATIELNGRKVRALFDTGAPTSVLSLAVAKELGVTPTSPGVVAAGTGSGIGSRQVRSWYAPFDKLDLGGEIIPKPKMHIAEIDLGRADMLVGIDFFLTHRVFVSNATNRMFFTYEGGPVFGLTPNGARDGEGKAIDLTDQAAAPTDAAGYARRGAVLLSNRRVAEALADFDKAVAMAPEEGHFYYQRATARLADRQMLPALADLDRAVTLAPADADARLARAGLRLSGGDREAAKTDLAAADAALAPSANARMTLGAMYNRVDMAEAAAANYGQWLRTHRDDGRRGVALNGRCWALAVMARELDQALDDCNAALKLSPGSPTILDSRALVQLRRGDLTAALADYDAALKVRPRQAWSLYARGIAAAKAGRAEEARANRAAALAINARIGEQAKKIGLE